MRLWPYGRFVLLSDDPPDVVAGRLRQAVAQRWFYVKLPSEPFRGEIIGTHFRIRRAPSTIRRSIRAVIIGDMLPSPTGTELRVRVRLHRIGALSIAVWFALLLLFIAWILWTAVTQGFGPHLARSGFGVGLAVAGGTGLSVWLIVNLSFWADVKKAREQLREHLKCGEVSPTSNRLGC